MALFIIAVLIVFISTGICALVEAALFAVPLPHIRNLAQSHHRAGPLLEKFKAKMEHPISAILILDTLLGVCGATIAGSQARILFGAENVIWFSVAMSAFLLILSQIIPKIVGVVYCKSVAKSFALPVSIAITVLYPVIWLIERITRFVKPDSPIQMASEEEVKQMARISAEEGSILGVESELIQNSLQLNDVRAVQIMTPRQKVLALPAKLTVKEAFVRFRNNAFSQVPIYYPGTEQRWDRVVTSEDILSEMAQDHFELPLEKISRAFHSVAAETPGHRLLDAFLKRRTNLFGVNDPKGKTIGIVSLADVVEEIVGEDLETEVSA
jgi:CBS domain containing-hemolysin-like protein